MPFVKGVSGNPKGRPLKADKKRVTLNIRFKEDEMETLKRIAEKEKTNVSALVKTALSEYYLNHHHVRPRTSNDIEEVAETV